MNTVTTSALADERHLALPLDLDAARRLLDRLGGGALILNASLGLEVRVEVLDAMEPGELRVQPGDTLYSVLGGSGLLGVAAGAPLSLESGQAAVVPGGTRHVLVGNPEVTVLVVTAPAWSAPTSPLALCRRQ